jgi:nuclear receptor subfamily 4 group A protein 2
MVKEVVRTDSLKGRRGRLPSKPKSPQDGALIVASSASGGGGHISMSQPVSLAAALVRAHVETSPDLGQLDYSQYRDLSEEDLETKSGLMETEAARIAQFYSLLNASLDVIRAFCERIPGYGELIRQDRELLFQSAALELFTLRLAYRYAFLLFCIVLRHCMLNNRAANYLNVVFLSIIYLETYICF